MRYLLEQKLLEKWENDKQRSDFLTKLKIATSDSKEFIFTVI